MEVFETRMNSTFKLVAELDEETHDVYFSVNYIDNGERAESYNSDLIGLVEAYCEIDSQVEVLFIAQSILLKVTQWITSLDLTERVNEEPEYDAHMDVKESLAMRGCA